MYFLFDKSVGVHTHTHTHSPFSQGNQILLLFVCEINSSARGLICQTLKRTPHTSALVLSVDMLLVHHAQQLLQDMSLEACPFGMPQQICVGFPLSCHCAPGPR